MIKKCSVVKNNDAVTVFDFDGDLVQIPSIHEDKQFLNVRFENGHYEILPDDFISIEKNNGSIKNRKNKKQLD